jgi:hypothetical protein
MNKLSIAPCGVICDLCSSFQKDKNKCVGCNNTGNKPNHCIKCRIKQCSEKENEETLCIKCNNFPCKYIKNLDKRYKTKYGESPVENLQNVSRIGMDGFIKEMEIKWKCSKCGKLLCVHKNTCLSCETENKYYPNENSIKNNVLKKMGNEIIKNPMEEPNNNILENVLGKKYKLYTDFIENVIKLELIPDWNYYNDTKSWLCKILYNNKDILLAICFGYRDKVSVLFYKRDNRWYI